MPLWRSGSFEVANFGTAWKPVCHFLCVKNNTVASLGGGSGADRLGWHPPGGWHPREKNFVGKFTKNSGENEVGQIKKKRCRVTPWRGDIRVKAIKSDRAKKGRQVFQEKKRAVTPSVAAPGVTHPSDATRIIIYLLSCTVAFNALVQG